MTPSRVACAVAISLPMVDVYPIAECRTRRLRGRAIFTKIFLMKRLRRALGGTVALLVALGALGVAGAQALEFHTESEGATITASFPAGERAEAKEAFSFLIEKSYVDVCVLGKLEGATSKKTIGTLTLTPKLSECGLPWSMGACDLGFDAAGTLDITGASCESEPMTIKAFAFPPNGCLIRIGPQENLSGITYANEGTGASRQVKATLAIEKVHYTQVSGFPCPGGLGTFNKGELSAIFILRAENSEGKQQGLWLE
jgi:hypothetical protein